MKYLMIFLLLFAGCKVEADVVSESSDVSQPRLVIIHTVKSSSWSKLYLIKDNETGDEFFWSVDADGDGSNFLYSYPKGKEHTGSCSGLCRGKDEPR